MRRYQMSVPFSLGVFSSGTARANGRQVEARTCKCLANALAFTCICLTKRFSANQSAIYFNLFQANPNERILFSFIMNIFRCFLLLNLYLINQLIFMKRFGQIIGALFKNIDIISANKIIFWRDMIIISMCSDT